ncbi:GGDEF domain-containing protein [Candidatus Clostridium stratigraminis]|uniref:GGDEF domain-containing protein n=1 Tax=Candidatus Clostridium stratigraminis TaxID=3381661 RepID=A0ABW8T532_9CLOT
MEADLSKEVNKILGEAKHIYASNPNNSYIMSKEAYIMSKNNNLKMEEGDALISMSMACRSKSQINKMLEYSYDAYEIFKTLNVSLGQAKSLNLMGIAYFYSAMYKEALQYLLQAKDLLMKLKEDFLLSCVINNIGEVFRESEDYSNALKYFDSSLRICELNNFKINTASILSNMGEIYFLESKYEQAMEYFTQSYNILIKENEMVNLGEVENKLGKMHFLNKNYGKAEEYFYNALTRLKNVDNKFYIIDVFLNIAKLLAEKNPHRAFYYFEKAIRYSEKTNAKKKLSEIYKTTSEFYEKVGSYKEALEYFKKYFAVNQEIISSITANKLEIIKIEFSHLKEDSKFEKEKIINKRLELEISNQRRQLASIEELNKVLEKTTFEDELTGVPNRRYINYNLSKVFEERFLLDHSIVLFIIDIDNFKKYNDFWGHLEGDKCLIKIANCLEAIQIERGDIFGRFGGEEFIYYALGINFEEAIELGNYIRTEVEKLDIKYTSDNESKVLTISVGGALGKASDFYSITSIIEIADKELYKAKNMGRNITLLNEAK